LNDATQPIEIEQVLGCHSWRTLGRRTVVGAAQGDGGVTPVGENDDKVRIVSSTNSNNFDTLATKGMMRMGDSDKSRRWLG
jgi:hypothetical protein